MPRRFRVRPSAVVEVVGNVARHPANRDAPIRAVARTLMFQLRGRLLKRPSIVPYGRTSQLYARVDDGASRRAAYSPLPDFAEMSIWLEHLQPGDLFVDVGASVGLYSLLAAERGAELLCFEPLPRSRRQLHQNLELNGYTAQVIPKALSATPGHMTLAGVDAQRVHLTDDDVEGGTQVEVDTLDNVLGDRTAAGVKIDVEGAERLVLQGAHRALTEQRLQLIQLEWNEMSVENFGEGREPLAELLTSAGYELLRPDDDGRLVPITDISPGPDVFARPSG